MPAIIRRLLHALRRSGGNADLHEEIEAHRRLRQEALERTGLTPEEAVYASRRALGNMTLAIEEAGELWRPRWLHGIGLDLRLAMRSLSAAPVISSAAILSIGLGIGATTAIFSIINSVYFRPLPVEHPDGLVYVTGPTRTGRAGAAVWQELGQRPGLFGAVAAYAGAQFNISPTSEARWVDGLWVSGSFFGTLGVRPFAGRVLTGEDDRPGAAPAAVISHRLWARQFGGTLDAIGRRLSVNDVPFTIVGVAPAEFFGPTVGRSFDVIVPLTASQRMVSAEIDVSPDVMARLRPGQTLAQANAALETLLQENDAEPPRAVPAATGQPPIGFRQQYRTPLSTLMVVATLVLLIACANIANLLLARATTRHMELSVRRALGAGRWRLVRQCLVESAMLAAAGAATGILLAFWASRLLVQQLGRADALTTGLTMYGSARLFLDVSFDWRVLVLTTFATVAAGLMFGVAPALRAAAADPIDAIKAGAPTSTRAAPSVAARFTGLRLSATQGLLVAQVALSLALLATAGLFLRTLTSLAEVPIGFDADRVLVVDVNTARAGDAAQQRSASERTAAAVRTLPGVDAVSLSVGSPPIAWGVRDGIAIAGIETPRNSDAAIVLVSPEWFRVFGVPVLAGREFTERDSLGAAPVAVVNQAFVERFLGDTSPLGHTVVSFDAPIDIVGVVGNVMSGPRTQPEPVMFVPLAQADGRLAGVVDLTLASYGLSMAVRAESRPDALIPRIATHVGRSEPLASLTFRVPRDQIAALTVRERVLAALSGFFGVLALLLSALGLYGVAAYAVARQRKEMAVRLALGAGTRRVIRLVLRRVLLPVAAGVGVGAALTLWSARFIAALLFGVEPHDLPTLAVAALVLLGVAAFAAWLPTHRVARIDPAVVLRYE